MNSREAFERYQAKEIKMDYEEFKARFDYQEQNFESRYASGSELSREFKVWNAAWQEQQKVVDEQHSMLLNQAKAMLELQEQNRILQNAADIEEQLKIELQKRIDAALEIISCLTDEYTKSELEKALLGGQ